MACLFPFHTTKGRGRESRGKDNGGGGLGFNDHDAQCTLLGVVLAGQVVHLGVCGKCGIWRALNIRIRDPNPMETCMLAPTRLEAEEEAVPREEQKAQPSEPSSLRSTLQARRFGTSHSFVIQITKASR